MRAYFRAYRAQFERGHRPNIDEKLLANLKIAAAKLDLSRLFFAVVEDYVNEKALEVMTFIDGGAHDYDFYEIVNKHTVWYGHFVGGRKNFGYFVLQIQ